MRVNKVGEESAGVCQGGVPLPFGVHWSEQTVRVSAVTLPAVPIIAEIAVAVTVSAITYAMPDIHSISELVNWFDSLVYQGTRILNAFYNNNEYELCTAASGITLNAGLATLLKFPAVIAANACLSSYIDPDTFTPLYKGYVVKLVGRDVFGIHTHEVISDALSPESLEETIAVIGSDQDCSKTPQLSFRTRPVDFFTKVYFRGSDNTLTQVSLDTAEYFEVVFDLSN